MINEATFADRRRIHTPVIFWTIQAHNVTKQKKKGKKNLETACFTGILRVYERQRNFFPVRF